MVVNRLAAAGILLTAIHDLHEPAADLLQQGEELAAFIRQHLQQDGSIRTAETGAEPTADGEPFGGMALYGLAVSQRHRPAVWKAEALARALLFYRQAWKSRPLPAMTAWLTLAFAEHFVGVKDRGCAEFVLEMGDWMCIMQYATDARNAKWTGGFKAWLNGKPALTAPSTDTALILEALAQACLITRHLPDAQRYARYREAIDLGAPFLMGLQYTDGNTLHFTPGYRAALIGGYHSSHEDGNLHVGHQAHAVGALVAYLEGTGAR